MNKHKYVRFAPIRGFTITVGIVVKKDLINSHVQFPNGVRYQMRRWDTEWITENEYKREVIKLTLKGEL